MKSIDAVSAILYRLDPMNLQSPDPDEYINEACDIYDTYMDKEHIKWVFDETFWEDCLTDIQIEEIYNLLNEEVH